MKEESIHYHRSVVGACEEHMQHFNDLLLHATELASLCTEGEKLVRGYVQIIGDIWFAFYSPTPVEIEQRENQVASQIDFLEHLLSLEEYEAWRIYTVNDSLLSALTTITIAEQLLHFLQQDSTIRKLAIKRKFDEQKQQLASEKIQELLCTDNVVCNKSHRSSLLTAYQQTFSTAKKESEQSNHLTLQKVNAFKSHLQSRLANSMPHLKEKKEAIVILTTLDGRKFEQTSLKEQFKLTNAILRNKSVMEVAEIVGRFKKIAKKKMKAKSKTTMERKSVTIGNELNRLVPFELANYMIPSKKLDFLVRYAEGQTMIYERNGKDRKGKGPIIICIDESSSMSSIRMECKAFCLALLSIAQKGKRDLAIIPFASDTGETFVFSKGKTDAETVLQFTQSFLGGGTNYEKPLQKALSILSESQFNEADIIFVTDGSSFLPSSFIEEFNAIKRRRKFECIAVALTNHINTVDMSIVSSFSDRVMEVQQLYEAEDVFLI